MRCGVLFGLFLILTSCFSREEKPVSAPPPEVKVEKKVVVKEAPPEKDKSLETLTRYFEQADAIHREAWWVLSSERRTVGKSPFGKVQRALLSSENIKLPNKSAFSCDRYSIKRDVLGVKGFPQKVEVFERCSEKVQAKRLAQVDAISETDLQVVFFPDGLEEILGLGAVVLNKQIQCTLRGNERGQLIILKCKDWAQDRTKEQMIRLDVYDYERQGKNLIKLRGKVYENLTDTRKIEADVPMDGKIFVTETELYPPEAPPPVKPTAMPLRVGKPSSTPAPLPPESLGEEQMLQMQQVTPEEIAPEITPILDQEGNLAIPPPRVDPPQNPGVNEGEAHGR